jgi:hypothetical protein
MVLLRTNPGLRESKDGGVRTCHLRQWRRVPSRRSAMDLATVAWGATIEDGYNADPKQHESPSRRSDIVQRTMSYESRFQPP